MYFLLKVLVSALVIAGVSELARRSLPLAAILASLPLTSLLALLWLYHDTGDGRLAGALSTQIFWATLPSLLFFLVFPWLLKLGVRFPLALALAVGSMAAGYTLYAALLKRLGIPL